MASNFNTMVEELRSSFLSGNTKSLKFRKQQLKNFGAMIRENIDPICTALKEDLSKPRQESLLLEINVVLDELTHTLNNIDEWVQPEKISKTIVTMFDSPIIYHDAYGVVLVIGAWNYPFQLSLLPALGAIAAGNCVIVKPSEMAAASSSLMTRLIPKYLDKSCVRVVEGDVKITTELLKERFDYIFFTGSPMVGKIVREAANKHLTPTTLELGGKSPVYLDDSVDFDVAVRRILWGKFINAGQTCIAPDYVLCSQEVQAKLIRKAKEVLEDFYGADPRTSPDFCRIINERHAKRLSEYLSDGNVAIGGVFDVNEKYISPTIMTDVPLDSKLMTEEIFGPILPIVIADSPYEAIKFINERERPLVTYLFSNSKNVKLILENSISGGVCVNDTMLQMAVPGLPFGGVGNSGMGNYHGKASYLTFTHRKSCLHRNYNIIADVIGKQRYPPYTQGKLTFLSNMVKERWMPPTKYLPHLLCFGLGAAAVVLSNYVRKIMEED